MSWFTNLVDSVKNYFSAPTTQTSWPSAPTPNYPSVKQSTPSYSSQIQRQSYPSYSAPKSTPTISSQPRISSGGGGVSGGSSGGGNQSLPSNNSAPQPDILDRAASKIVQFERAPLATTVGGIGKIGQGIVRGANIMGNNIQAGTAYTPATPEAPFSLFQGMQDIAGNPNLNIQDVIDYLKKGAGDVSGRTLWQSIPTKQMLDSISNNRYPYNIAGTGISTSNLPGNQNNLPSSLQGASQRQAPGVVPSAVEGARGGMVPSGINAATLPANMQGLTQANTNPALTQNMTPEAIQSIGQLLLRSLLGNQSSLTSLSPGIAQALWGAPTASSAFGGYEGGAAVPNQSRVSQPANLPPVPQPLATG